MNKVCFLGRLTHDPEIRYSQSRVAVTRFSIAVNRRFPKPGEERQADFFNCVCFSSTAEFVSKYFVKGRQILLTGHLQNRKWEDGAGQKRTATEVMVDEVYFVDSGRERDKAAEASSGNGSTTGFGDDDGFLPIENEKLPY